jgi:hypothetical protein
MESSYLTAFYKDVSDEIRRLREEQWKLSYYFIAEGMGVFYLFADGKVSKYVNYYTLLFVLVLQFGCVFMYLYHLHRNHTYIGRARNVRRRLEVLFGVTELKTPDGAFILPAEWKGSVSKWFEYDTVVAPLGLFVFSVQAGTLYVIITGLLALNRC